MSTTPGTEIHQPEDPLAAHLAATVIGQHGAVDAVSRAVRIARAGLGHHDRPLSVLLFAGPTGVGKTSMVRALAGALRAGPEDYCRIDMSALAQEHYAASFSGAPPGYSGSKESTTLFDKSRIEGDPYTPGLVLFDEVEKAHPVVIRALLHVLDNGVLRLSSGAGTIGFRNCHVILTTNLGSRRSVARRPWWSFRSPDDAIGKAIESFFDPEFFNRIDEVVRFAAIDRGAARQIVDLELGRITQVLARRYVHIDFDDSLVGYLVEQGFDPRYGARALRRSIRRHLLPAIADAVDAIAATRRDPAALHVVVDSGQMIACRPSHSCSPTTVGPEQAAEGFLVSPMEGK
ncbi:AAA family ATPase [Williamsia sp. DF01-3]|uniref:AAA family ATPase n=1 Tax=Williamsia sp. DF01-3 TaxID=2934157 RepID=UPI001FF1216D|nr:AAA family ATPase [Williamsia sp. DF01-3]MCK0517401.1 AAA family ATPase [Williamsia sp. DF01-3]